MKKSVIIAVVLGLLLLIFSGCSQREDILAVEIHGEIKRVSGYTEIEEAFVNLYDVYATNKFVIYDSSELTAEVLENRNGTLIIERCVGLVTNKQTGDGKVLNPADEMYDYIRYDTDQLISDGTVMLTYLVYNPRNNYVDDITERYDFILDREWED